MRLALLPLLLVLLLPAEAPPADAGFEDRLVKFDQHWDRFKRAYYGCSKEATRLADCHAAKQFDYAEFVKAAKDARPLFALEER